MNITGKRILKEDIKPGDKIYVYMHMNVDNRFTAESYLLVDHTDVSADSLKLYSVGLKALGERGPIISLRGNIEEDAILSKLDSFPSPDLEGFKQYHNPADLNKDRCSSTILVLKQTGEWFKITSDCVSADDSEEYLDAMRSGKLAIYGRI